LEAGLGLTLQTDYALRTLMYLATHRERARISEVAELFGISNAHVAKVVNQLARLGLVRSMRGIGGGIELAQPAEQIYVGHVITAFEGHLHLLDCVETGGVCAIESFCKLKQVLAEAERLQTSYLNQVTLADVIPTPRQMAGVRAST
jgi:Rrf2 family transcriptional regulator, nitric oxide-sensitive transcriptional repressor